MEKVNFSSLLPSEKDIENYISSSKSNSSNLLKTLAEAIDEKYVDKIHTLVEYELIKENLFNASIYIKFNKRFADHCFHFISFEKPIDMLYPITVYAFVDKVKMGIVEDYESLDILVTKIIKDDKTSELLISNIN